jgi:hypothetical protein
MAGRSRGGAIALEGLREIQKNLEALGATKSDFIALNVQAAETITQAAIPRMPVYTGTRNSKTGKKYVYKAPGSLRRSVKVSKTKNYAQITVGNKRVPYAKVIEYGWLYDKNNFVEKNIRPNLALTNAIENNRDKVFRQYDKGIDALFQKYGFKDN